MTGCSGLPESPRRPVVDEIHGRTIVDHYRWLEDDQDPEVVRWSRAQNDLTERVLGSRPEREVFHDQLVHLLAGDTVGSAVIRENRVFFTYRMGSQDQPALYIRDLVEEGSQRVLVDPNPLSGEGTVSLDWWHVSPGGNLVAYGLSQDGDEWSTLRVIRVDGGEILPLEIPRTRHSSVAWDSDEGGFHYTRYPQKGDVPEGEEDYHRRVFYHKLGTDPLNDPMVFGEGRAKEDSYFISRSTGGRYLLLIANQGWNRGDVYVQEEGQTEFTPIATGEDALFWGQIVDRTLFLLTNYRAPRYRVVAVDLTDPKPSSWREVIPENEEMTLQVMRVSGGRLLVAGLVDASSRLSIHEVDGTRVMDVDPGTLGTVSDLAAEPGNPVALVRFESFFQAPTLYRIHMGTGQMSPWLQSHSPIDPGLVEINQVFYRSRDGTRVPMFIMHRKDLELHGPAPTLLTGYGGFNISRTPTYSPAQYPWIERGGIFALANLRGGSEYGEQWHRGGMMENKQNVFDDFIAAGEYLVGEGYTDKEHLGIMGRSNGGLLVGAAMTQRPDLFRAVICGVPLLDMVRFHRFLIANMWTSEYGSPDDPAAFEWIYDYSPYHHVKEGEEYPGVYLFTASSDTRVHPLHARKMTALLQYATRRDPTERPVLLTVESAAGHGAGKPVGKVVSEQASILAFLAWQLGLE